LLLLCTAPSHNSLVPHLYVSNLWNRLVFNEQCLICILFL
jgi:hypothetical protein